MGPIELILGRILLPIVNWFSGRDFLPECPHCGTKTERNGRPELLFLLPVMIDGIYNPTAAFFLNKTRIIQSLEAIPPGQRACWMRCYSCPVCHERAVGIDDFLHVRGEQLLKGRYVYEYKKFESFILEYEK